MNSPVACAVGVFGVQVPGLFSIHSTLVELSGPSGTLWYAGWLVLAIVVLPIAMQTALQLGLDARPFAMIVAVAASCSYLTPLEPACLLVYGPGRYRFSDFFKIGAPLTVLIYGVAIILVPRIWPVIVTASAAVASRRRAMPKSTTFGWPCAVTRTFPGLRSR